MMNQNQYWEIAFPFYVDPDGLIGSAGYDDHIRQMIEQLIFTSPGERVNRPQFGCGLDRVVFDAAGNEMITVTQALLQSELQRYLSDLIQVETAAVQLLDSTLLVTIRYVVLRTGQQQEDQFQRNI